MDQEWSLEGHHTRQILLLNNNQVKQLVDVCQLNMMRTIQQHFENNHINAVF